MQTCAQRDEVEAAHAGWGREGEGEAEEVWGGEGEGDEKRTGQHTSAYVSIRQHSIRQHTSAYVIREGE